MYKEEEFLLLSGIQHFEFCQRQWALMHQCYKRKHTLKVKSSKKCSACSLKEICLPKRNRFKTVEEYIEKSIDSGV
ncbi:MAG: hypothetical protein LUG66_00650 [Clostridiales bacterium]|nr:hypothetical protein [Clostridiales bacterium]